MILQRLTKNLDIELWGIPFSNGIQFFVSKEVGKKETLTAEFIRCFDLLYPGQYKKIK